MEKLSASLFVVWVWSSIRNGKHDQKVTATRASNAHLACSSRLEYGGWVLSIQPVLYVTFYGKGVFFEETYDKALHHRKHEPLCIFIPEISNQNDLLRNAERERREQHASHKKSRCFVSSPLAYRERSRA